MKIIYLDHSSLTKDRVFSALTADAAVGAGTIVIQDTRRFTTNDLMVVGNLGNELTEIRATHASTAATSTLVTLAGTLQFAHPQDTPVAIAPWDTVEFSWSSTVAGTKTVLGTLSIDVTSKNFETYYEDTAQTEGFYFTRFQDLVNTVNSSYSDAVPFGDYAYNTIYKVKQAALEDTNTEVDGILITNDWLNRTIFAARREIHDTRGKRPWRQSFNSDLGNTSLGQYIVAVPSDLQKPYTSENLFGVRIGNLNDNLDFIDKKKWDEWYRGVAHTTLSVGYTSGTGELTLNDTRDFDNSGSINIEDESTTYSSKNNTAGTIKLSKAFTVAHGTLTDVWQGITPGLPIEYAVMNIDGTFNIAFNIPVGTTHQQRNIWVDYYRTLSTTDSDADTLDEPDQLIEAIKRYAKAKIKKRKDPSINLLQDDDWIEWLRLKGDYFDSEYLGQDIRITPSISHLQE